MNPQTSLETAPKLAPLPALAPKVPMPQQMAFPTSVHIEPKVDPQVAPPAYLQPQFQGPQMAPTSPQAARHMVPPGAPPQQAPLPITFVGMPMPPPGYQMAGPGSPQSPVSPAHALQVYPQLPRQAPPPPVSPHATFHQNPLGDPNASPPGNAKPGAKRGRPKGSRKRSLDTAIGSNRSIQPAPKRTPNSQSKINAQASPPGMPHAPLVQSPNFMQHDPAGGAAVLQASPTSHHPGYARSQSKGSLESILQPSAPASNVPPPRYGQPDHVPRPPVNYQPGSQRYPPIAPSSHRPEPPGDLPTAPANYRPPLGNPLSPTGYRNPRAGLDNILQGPGRSSFGNILQTSPTSASPPGSLERARQQPNSPVQMHNRKASLESILLPSPTAGSASPTAGSGGFERAHPPPLLKSPKSSLSMILHPNEDGGSPLESRAPLLPHGPPRGSPLETRPPPPPHSQQRGSPLDTRAPPLQQQHAPPRGSPLETRPPPPPPHHSQRGSPLDTRAPPLQQQPGPPRGSPQGNAPGVPYGSSPTAGKGNKSDIHKLLQ
jgi:hypothetical protein